MDEQRIRNVWKHNLESEIQILSEHLKKYNYVAMDTEFPGVIAKPNGIFSNSLLYTYNQIRCNIDLLGLIQLGISISDENGNVPSPSTWQFNFYFNRNTTMSSHESMHLLEEAGIDFNRLMKDGIPVELFADYFTTSGLLMNKNLKWVSFHSSYDFGYLLNALSGEMLPLLPDEFFSLLCMVFPNFYDIKYLLSLLGMKGGLQDLADDLGIKREGIQHQAGSDALLTLQVFHTFKEKHIPQVETDPKYKSKLFGIDVI
ncbi:CCR4-NOT transcription complex subunit 7/8 [Nematocida sp. LUAm3]|nr:CCR4-NOT transcription complex subunit 7/8 [Nematocida sp. LUAm3]KAI5174691.1 CCR4-NOT transcription complex subunit 7/8 [Nematocida sp. LUAm2]KAI5177898.1 CCR4-NOT transcription complex subunit 7/8 [Nematocida sp. LUAm1]